MTTSFWRYSHLALAVSSFLFLFLASITGAILSVEPIIEKSKPYAVGSLDGLKLSETIPLLNKEYAEITRISLENNRFVLLEGTDKKGKSIKAYVDPKTGKILGVPSPKNEFFQWITALHRSLFLHEAGRFFIGLTSFLLILIALSGIMLTIKRQRGIRRLLAKIPNDKSAQYYHVVAGRIALVFILLIAISGTHLSLNTLGIIKSVKANVKANVKVDFDAIKSEPKQAVKDFQSFKNINLSEVKTIEFPFSDDIEDYFILTLKDREVAINQITGEILGESKYPFSILIADLSMKIHTGRSSIIWAGVLGISSISILFFIYSGFAITLKRISKKSKNKYSKHDCNFILLVGSENGTTSHYAASVHKSLLKQGKKAYLTAMNNYSAFANAEHLLIFSSTYGEGEAPTNASKFFTLLNTIPQVKPLHYSVLGFGSKAYPDFCKFAFDVHNTLSSLSWASPLTDIHTVDDGSPLDLMRWQESWSQKTEIPFNKVIGSVKKQKLKVFTVQGNEFFGNTFLINLKGRITTQAKSGDLLAIYPANDYRERLYSIGMVNKSIQLSVKLHENGLGSAFLNALKKNDKLKARVVKNTHFHFPANAPKVIMISNGTGIAPFLGMIDENKFNVSCHLYCGFKDASAFQPFHNFLNTSRTERKLEKLSTAYSRSGNKQYVSHLIAADGKMIAESLMQSAVIMICGSLSMQKDLLIILAEICSTRTAHPISFYQSRNQIRMDCY